MHGKDDLMILNLKRYLSLLLVLMLLIGIVPKAYAAETISGSIAPEESITETVKTTDSTEDTEPTDPTEPTEPPGEDSALNDLEDAVLAGADNAIMLSASTTSNVLLFDQASPNYTTYLTSQISVTYKPNGTGNTVTAYHKNLGWHFARINGVSYPDDPIYCIEPHKGFAASTPGNYVDDDVTVDGSGSTRGSNVWYAMPASYREAIALVLLYSCQMWDNSYSVMTTAMANNPNVPLKVATQFLIYEIVTGLRNPETFVRNSSNGYTSGDVYYNAGVSNVSGFASRYNALVSSVQAALKIPSFTSRNSSGAPTITLTGITTTVTDSNGVLSNFTFTNGNGASFSKSGNSLTITQTGTISESTVFAATRYLPSAPNSSFSIYYGATSTYQVCVKLYTPSSENVSAYFKLKAPASITLAIKKATEDGDNLSGWRFGIYSDSACTSLVSGPYTTDSGGNISVSNLTPGTVYVKELGHTDSAIDALYTCASTNPQKVSLADGQTSGVSFYNKLNTGNVKLVKTTNTGENLDGWQIGLYTDSACTSPVSGSPFTTREDGTITVTGLQPGTLYAKELPGSDTYWQYDAAVKTVTIVANQTAAVTFFNTHNGRAKIIKSMPDGGSVAGWKFEVSSGDGKVLGTFTTGEDGAILTGYLLPGEYTVKEILPEDSPYICDAPNPKTVTVVAGQTPEASFTNRLKPGEILVQKVDTQGDPLAGAEFLLEWSVDGIQWTPVTYMDSLDAKEGTCTSEGLTDGHLTSGEDGIVRFTGLHPLQLYRLTETKAPEGYQLLAEPVHEGSIQVGNEYFVQLTVVNAPAFELPMTGSMGSAVQNGLQIAGAAIFLAALVYLAKKRR